MDMVRIVGSIVVGTTWRRALIASSFLLMRKLHGPTLLCINKNHYINPTPGPQRPQIMLHMTGHMSAPAPRSGTCTENGRKVK